MEKLDFRFVEAGYDLYAPPFRVLRLVIIPLVKPGIVAGCILTFIPSLGADVTPNILGGGKNLMIGNLIGLQFGQGHNWPLGAALSVALMTIMMAGLLFFCAQFGRIGKKPWQSRFPCAASAAPSASRSTPISARVRWSVGPSRSIRRTR